MKFETWRLVYNSRESEYSADIQKTLQRYILKAEERFQFIASERQQTTSNTSFNLQASKDLTNVNYDVYMYLL
jgi:hypothetical protein